jgi:hypothetical protein
MTLQEELRQAVNTIRVKPYPIADLIPLLNRAADLIGGLQDLNSKAEQHVLDAIERGKALGYADGMMARPNNVVAMPCDELKKMQDQLAHLKKMVVWYQDITMTGINSEEYENGFWDAVNFVKLHQVKDKN